jgi:signal peptide peptidase SppA
VLQIGVRGAIAESGSPVLGAAGGSVSQVKRGLRMAAADDVLGVLLYIDSPGGGVTDSDEIWRLIRKFRQEHPQKPVVALFGDIAASGGYYVAAACERITAHRSTITGSIGVIMSGWNFAEAAKKFGVEQIAIKSERTPFKDILSPTRPMRDDERALLTAHRRRAARPVHHRRRRGAGHARPRRGDESRERRHLLGEAGARTRPDRRGRRPRQRARVVRPPARQGRDDRRAAAPRRARRPAVRRLRRQTPRGLPHRPSHVVDRTPLPLLLAGRALSRLEIACTTCS